jgi:nucleotide-binding universal stress UspA family protein
MHDLLRALGTPALHGSDGVDEFSLPLPEGPVAARIPQLLAAVALATANRSAQRQRLASALLPHTPTQTGRSPMFARIIVGIDGADGGRDALALAKRLAGEDAELVLVTALPHDEFHNRASLGGFEQLLHDDTDKALRESAAGDARCRVHAVADSSPGRALHEEALREDADLIVVGSCHRGAVGRVLLGDVSRATLHGAHCPVAIAPRGYHEHERDPIHTIGVGFNNTAESTAAVALGARLAEAAGGELRLLTAVTSPATSGPAYMYSYNWSEIAAESRLMAELEISKAADVLTIPVETETIDESPGIALEHLSEHVDLVLAGSRGWGATHRVVLGSTTDHVTHHAHCPVIVVPSPVAAVAEPVRGPQEAAA